MKKGSYRPSFLAVRIASGVLFAWVAMLACGGPSSKQVIERSASTAAALTSSLSISGQARNAAGAPLAGVAIQLAGTAQGTKTTDSNGNYTFSGLGPGSYTLQANLFGCVFFPPLATLTGVQGSTVQNFDGSGLTCGGLPSANLSLSGTVLGANGSPLTGRGRVGWADAWRQCHGKCWHIQLLAPSSRRLHCAASTARLLHPHGEPRPH